MHGFALFRKFATDNLECVKLTSVEMCCVDRSEGAAGLRFSHEALLIFCWLRGQ